MLGTVPASEKTKRPMELDIHSKRESKQDGETQRGAHIQGDLDDQNSEMPRSGHTSALRVHLIPLSWCHFSSRRKIKENVEERGQPSFSRPFFVPERFSGPGHLESKHSLTQNTREERGHQCPF